MEELMQWKIGKKAQIINNQVPVIAKQHQKIRNYNCKAKQSAGNLNSRTMKMKKNEKKEKLRKKLNLKKIPKTSAIS